MSEQITFNLVGRGHLLLQVLFRLGVLWDVSLGLGDISQQGFELVSDLLYNLLGVGVHVEFPAFFWWYKHYAGNLSGFNFSFR